MWTGRVRCCGATCPSSARRRARSSSTVSGRTASMASAGTCASRAACRIPLVTDLVTITNGAFTARINPLGAELWSLTDAQGREYMTDADPAFWTGHAPLLFPIVGALRDGTYRLDGREYALPKHGFARTSRFEVVETLA